MFDLILAQENVSFAHLETHISNGIGTISYVLQNSKDSVELRIQHSKIIHVKVNGEVRTKHLKEYEYVYMEIKKNVHKNTFKSELNKKISSVFPKKNNVTIQQKSESAEDHFSKFNDEFATITRLSSFISLIKKYENILPASWPHRVDIYNVKHIIRNELVRDPTLHPSDLWKNLPDFFAHMIQSEYYEFKIKQVFEHYGIASKNGLYSVVFSDGVLTVNGIQRSGEIKEKVLTLYELSYHTNLGWSLFRFIKPREFKFEFNKNL